MKVIKDIKVVVQKGSSEKFRDELMECVEQFQHRRLEVKINSPRLVKLLDADTYIAVVEGYTKAHSDEAKEVEIGQGVLCTGGIEL